MNFSLSSATRSFLNVFLRVGGNLKDLHSRLEGSGRWEQSAPSPPGCHSPQQGGQGTRPTSYCWLCFLFKPISYSTKIYHLIFLFFSRMKNSHFVKVNPRSEKYIYIFLASLSVQETDRVNPLNLLLVNYNNLSSFESPVRGECGQCGQV